MNVQQRRLVSDRPLDLARTVGPLRHGAGDPVARWLRGTFWLGHPDPGRAGQHRGPAGAPARCWPRPGARVRLAAGRHCRT